MADQCRFLLEADRLKGVLRASPVLQGTRKENSAEHSWHLILFAVVLAEWADKAISIDRVIRMLLIHDLVEIDAGDTPLFSQNSASAKSVTESKAAERLFNMLPTEQATELRQLWEEYERRDTADSQFAHAIDRLQPILLNHQARGGTWTEFDVDIARERQLTAGIAKGATSFRDAAEAIYAEAIVGGWLRPENSA